MKPEILGSNSSRANTMSIERLCSHVMFSVCVCGGGGGGGGGGGVARVCARACVRNIPVQIN